MGAGADLHSVEPSRCQQCAAVLAGGAPWCSLCLAPALAEVAPTPAAQPARPDQQTSTWPCIRCGADVALALNSCPTCGGAFLAGADPLRFEVPVVGDLLARSRGQRLAMAVALALLLAVLAVGLLSGLGSLL